MRTFALQYRLNLWRAALVVALTSSASGCGGGGAATRPAAQVSSTPVPQPQSAPSSPSLTRSAIHAIVAQGLGAFLQHVELDDTPARVGGRFHGFRIKALHDGSYWSGVDLRPGDVVTRVNGYPIERPEQAQTAFESLETAKELRVSYERDGQPRELVYPILDAR